MLFLALRLLAPRKHDGARALLRAAWFGELGKLALTASGFAVVFTQVPQLSPGLVFAGFIAAQSVVLAALALPGGNTLMPNTGPMEPGRITRETHG